MSIALFQKIKELEKKVEVLTARLDSMVMRQELPPAVGFQAPEVKRSTITLRGKAA